MLLTFYTDAMTGCCLLRKIVDKSPEFVVSEINRVNKLINGKVSTEKKEELTEKLNILKSFSSITNIKDEL